MPFSRLGPAVSRPCSVMAPALGVSRPPTMRITVVLPQPEGPTKTTNSPSAIPSESGRTTSIVPPRGSRNDFVTPWNSMKRSVGMVFQRSAEITERAAMAGADELIGNEADDADGQDPGEHLGRLPIASRRPQLVADARVGSDDLRDQQVGPAPAERDPQAVDHVRQHRPEQHVPHQRPVAGAERPPGLDELLRDAPGIVGD